MNHSPIQKTVAPTHDEANIPMKKIKMIDVTNPKPARTRSTDNDVHRDIRLV